MENITKPFSTTLRKPYFTLSCRIAYPYWVGRELNENIIIINMTNQGLNVVCLACRKPVGYVLLTRVTRELAHTNFIFSITIFNYQHLYMYINTPSFFFRHP